MVSTRATHNQNPPQVPDLLPLFIAELVPDCIMHNRPKHPTATTETGDWVGGETFLNAKASTLRRAPQRRVAWRPTGPFSPIISPRLRTLRVPKHKQLGSL